MSPPSFLPLLLLSTGRKLERDLMWEGGGPGVYNTDFTKHWRLANPEWRTDHIPEIMDGKNIADFIDPDIMAKLEELEREEEQRVEAEEVTSPHTPAICWLPSLRDVLLW
jgi:hypothetical protein